MFHPKVLIYSNSSDPHVDFMEDYLINKKTSFFRINTDKLFLEGGIIFDAKNPKLFFKKEIISLDSVISIWNRRPKTPKLNNNEITNGMKIFSQKEAKSALMGILFSLNKKWINHPVFNSVANHKINQLFFAKTQKILIPETIITNDVDKVKSFFKKTGGDIIYKPLTWGVVNLENNSFGGIYTSVVTLDKKLLAGVRITPCIFQKKIDKQSDVRVTVFGNKLFAVEIMSNVSKNIDVRENIMSFEHKHIILPKKIEEFCFSLLSHYKLLFGCIDFVISKNGKWFFLEINPNGQWGWIEKKTDTPLRNALYKLLITPD